MSEQLFNQRLEDEISLKDIFNFLLESWKLIVLSGIVGGLLASGYVFMAPSKYQAVASIQVAKVVNVDVESPGVLMEKLNIPSFYSALTYSACNMTDAFDSGEIIAKNLKPTLSKISNVIYFSYLADSPEDARKCLQGILQDIRNSQNLLANPILEQKKNQMLNLKKRLDTVERVVKVLAEKNSSFNFSESNFSASALLFVTILSKENEIKDLRTQINDLEVLLSEPQTREILILSPIYASKQKISPRRFPVMISGLMAGLFLGLLFMIGKRSWLTHNMSNQ